MNDIVARTLLFLAYASMVGDTFNYGLKAKVDGLCSELSQTTVRAVPARAAAPQTRTRPIATDPTEEWPSSRHPTDEADAIASRSIGSTPHRNRAPGQHDPRETTQSVWVARRLHRRPQSPCSTPLSGYR